MSRPGSALERLRALEAAKAQAAAGVVSGEGGAVAGSPNRRGPIVGALTVIGLLVWKLKAVLLFALTKAKVLLVALNFGKILTTASTMLLMVWVYAQYYGLSFAAGLVTLILLHELGHGAAAKMIGLPVGAPVFIPFFGAFITLKERPRSTFEDFIVGAGGPLAGSLAAAICVVIGLGFESVVGAYVAGLLLVVGYFSLLMNLFNLTPVWQLDGARMTTPLTVKLRAFAAGGVVLSTLVATAIAETLNPLVAMIVLVVVWRAGHEWWIARRVLTRKLDIINAQSAQAAAVPDAGVTPRQRNIAFGVYVGLASALIVATHVLLPMLPKLGQ